MADLRALATDLRTSGISLVVDFAFNHTSKEHEWAKKAAERDPEYSDYYWIYEYRRMPDAFERTVREVFPDDHPGAFIQMDDDRWIWSTFQSFQWDLNYANPAVFCEMAGEMLVLANQGVDLIRMDAVAFIWKRLGTTAKASPRRIYCCGRSTACAASRRRRCCSSPKPSCTPTRSFLTSTQRNALYPTILCLWRFAGRRLRRARSH
jgi:glycosidase